MRRILVDARNAYDYNWSTSPQSEDPVGWDGSGEWFDDTYTRYSERSYLPGGLGIPVPVRRIAQFVRLDKPWEFNGFIDSVLFGTYEYPNTGPWQVDIPEALDATGVVNVSVYVRVSRDSSVTLTQDFTTFSSEPLETVSAPTDVPANTWVRVNWTFPTSNDESPDPRRFNIYAKALTPEGAVPGDAMWLAGALMWNADEVVPFFDGGSDDAWWNLRAGRDAPGDSRAPGQVQSVRYRVND